MEFFQFASVYNQKFTVQKIKCKKMFYVKKPQRRSFDKCNRKLKMLFDLEK